MKEISPLFAVEAEQLLFAGQIDDAFEMCKEGLEEYPEYPSGYAIYAKCCIEKSDFDSAIQLLDKAIYLFPTNRQIRSISKQLMEKINNVNKPEELNSVDNEVNYNLNNAISEISISSDNAIEKSDPDDIIISDEFENININIYENNDKENINKDFEIVSLEEKISDLVEIKGEIIDLDQEFAGFHTDGENEIVNLEELFDVEVLNTENIDNSHYPINSFLKFIPNENEFNDEIKSFRASDLGLIPGLEFSALKLMQERSEEITYINELPDFPEFKNFEIVKSKPKSAINSFIIDDYSIPNDYLENDPFNQLAQKLDSVKSSKSENIENSFNSEDESNLELVSPTLAKIYESQGAYQLAIEMFFKLIEKEPNRNDEYSLEIERLKEKLDLM